MKSFRFLTNIYSDAVMSRSCVNVRYKRFFDSRTEVDGERRVDRN